MVVPALQEHFGRQDYDWRATILRVPDPRPVTRIVRQGVEGLAEEDLLTVALALAERSGGLERDLLTRVFAVLERDGLLWRLERRRARQLESTGLPSHLAESAANAWTDEYGPLNNSGTLGVTQRRLRSSSGMTAWYPGEGEDF